MTTEVVDLISSDTDSPVKHIIPVQHPQQLSNGIRRAASNVARKPIKADDYLSLDEDDEFPWLLPAKRRKLESTPVSRAKENVTAKVSIPSAKLNAAPSKSQPAVEVDDEIVFTSPPKRDIQGDIQAAVWTVIGSEDNVSEGSPVAIRRTGLSSRTAALLDEIRPTKPAKKRSNKGKEKAEAISDSDEIPSRSHAKTQTKDSTGVVDKAADREAKALQREQQRRDKDAEKELAKQAREEARVAKAAEKQRTADIASVNRSKMDKNVTTPEMIVDFPSSMDGSSSLTQSREFLRAAGTETNLYTSKIPGVIKFRRKVRADFNDAEGCFMPLRNPRVDDEKLILLYILAEDFARLVSPLTAADDTVEQHLDKLRNLHPSCRIIIVIEGLEKLIAKEKNASNRAYQAAVRRTAAAATDQETADAAQPVRRRQNKANTPVIVDEPAIEAALLSLQIKHSIQTHHCTTPLDTGETILTMTQQLSLSRYRDPPVLTAAQLAVQPNFCMSTGQVPTGRSVEDTYLKILQQVIRVTEREATAIARVYPTVGSLFRAFRSQGDKVLENIMKEGGGAKGATNGVTAAERRIGPRTSERFGRILLGLDPGELIG